MNTINTDKYVSSSEWARNFSKYLEKVKEVGELYVIKNCKPEAVVLDVEEYNRLARVAELVENLEIVKMLDSRKKSTVKYTLSEAMKKLGITEDDLKEDE